MSDRIDVIVTGDAALTAEEKVRGAFPGARAPARLAHVAIETAVIDARLREVIDSVAANLFAEDKPANGYEVDEIELSLAIDAKGSVSLIGTVELGGSAGIKVKIKRKAAHE